MGGYGDHCPDIVQNMLYQGDASIEYGEILRNEVLRGM
jgi:hypothetical protein